MRVTESYRHMYRQWLNSPYIDEMTREELRAIEGDDVEIQDRFYKQLEFGTGGMRGLIGAGTNRINTYTIRRATQGLANYISRYGPEAKQRGVVIAYDSRHLSMELSLETACTLVANGIRVRLFESLRPTPELSFAVRACNSIAGIVLTASHNPPAYNGYKVYWEDGAQIASARATDIIAAIEALADFEGILSITRAAAEASGLLQWIGSDIDDRYLQELRQLCLNQDVIAQVTGSLKIVYTPLHGAGSELVQRILHEVGFTQVYVVPEQELPDPNFSTVESANPEERAVFELSVQLAVRLDANLIIGTDPDCDRVGVVVRDRNGQFRLLSGNQTGALLLHYILSQKQARGEIPRGATLVKTIVTSELGRVIADSFGVETVDVLIGFKYISEQIAIYEATGERTFLLGYEESGGYLVGTLVREKDGVMASLLIAEMAAYHHSHGRTLDDVLQELYAQFGYYREQVVSRTLTGIDGLQMIRHIMETWRNEPTLTFGNVEVVERKDYLRSTWFHRDLGEMLTLDLPQENVLHYTLNDGSWFCLRPSGTEPKIKIYVSTRGETAEEAEAKVQWLAALITQRIDALQEATADSRS